MSKFVATHKIDVPGDALILVQAVDPGDGDGAFLVLYTETEWESEARADWEYSPERGLTFQGRAIDGSSFRRI